MNPFKEKPAKIQSLFTDREKNYTKPYNKHEVNPYTRTRIILMNGTEFEANWFCHQAARHTNNTDLRREMAAKRMQEKNQQLDISLLKPEDESQLEHTIGYEQLAVDLTAELAKREKDFYVKKALDFALLEDFDHLYRYADLLEMREGVLAEQLVGKYTEIMPGRPTVAHHRHPMDNVRRPINSKSADTMTTLATMIITAAEQQTMNYYMNVTTLAKDSLSRKLYREIALVEEEHVTQYEDLMDPCGSWLETALWHEYTECYLYWSCYMTETDDYIKALWEKNYVIEVSHLHKTVELLKKFEKKEACEVIPDGEFPEPLSLHENIEYVREILKNTVQYTSIGEEYALLDDIPSNAAFFTYQKQIMPKPECAPSHKVICEHIDNFGRDYRFETKTNPVPQLTDVKCDNVQVGREKNICPSSGFKPNK